jgi:hypothetical protein
MVSITRALSAALRAAEADKRDVGAVALAKQYAALIDDASVLAKYDKPLDGLRYALDVLDRLEPLVGADAHEDLKKITDALAAHSVASDLGPKLLATLTQLGMTPAGRGVRGDARATVAKGLDELRARRASRAERARAD